MSDHACCWHQYEDVAQTNIQLAAILAYCCRRECKNVKILFGYEGMEENAHGLLQPFVPQAQVKFKIPDPVRHCKFCKLALASNRLGVHKDICDRCSDDRHE